MSRMLSLVTCCCITPLPASWVRRQHLDIACCSVDGWLSWQFPLGLLDRVAACWQLGPQASEASVGVIVPGCVFPHVAGT